jgi:solute carrier family 45 protein 1/2/4
MSLIAFSLVTFAGSVVLPWFIESPEEEMDAFTPRPPESIAWLIVEINKYKPKLVTAWSWSHIIFAGSMVMAPFVTSFRAATIIVAMCGIPWALACWAPFTFVGIEINKLKHAASNPGQAAHKTRDSLELEEKDRFGLLEGGEDQPQGSSGDLSGVYLGILNLYTTLPQFIGTFISWVVFSILEPGKSPELAKEAHPDEHHSTDGPNAIAVCLFIGALAAVVAAYATENFKRVLQRST